MTSKFDLENYSEVELGELIKEAEKLKASKAVQTKINAYDQLLEIAKGVGLSLDELIQFEIGRASCRERVSSPV